MARGPRKPLGAHIVHVVGLTEQMSSLRRRLASSARWSVAIRLVERVIGFGSTLILVRLLAPVDFGVVAMGTAIQEILSAVTAFGFTQALIRMPRRAHDAYSTAFTLNVITGVAIALILVASMPFAQRWYDDARVTHVLIVLALSSLVSGFRNTGLVRYERALDFRPFFKVAIARKAASFAVATSLALILKDYRALLAGMLASAIVETAITYRLTRFRPQFTLAKSRELLGFSVWWVASQAMSMLGRRGQDLLVGQRLGAASLGQFVVALDIVTMSTAELAGPVMRAVYPGYVQMKEETGRIYSAFVRVWGLIALLAIPSAVGTASLASLIAEVVLGPQWAAAAPLMTLLAVSGALKALNNCYWPLLLARLGPKANFILGAMGAGLSIPMFALGLWQGGLIAAIWASIGSTAVMLIVGARILLNNLGGKALPLLRGVVRPLIGALVMAAALIAVQSLFSPADSWFGRAGLLLFLVVFGAFTYLTTVTVLWYASGRPKGAETEFIYVLVSRLGQGAAP